jgi:small multidrug resistance pump
MPRALGVVPKLYWRILLPSVRESSMNWIFLSIAILSEVLATSSLRACESFTKFWPSVLVVSGYASAFYFLSLTLRTIPMGVAYAIWSGVGVILISLIAWIVYGQRLDSAAIAGICLIVAGVAVLNLFSKTVMST